MPAALLSWSGVSTLGRVVAHWRGLSRVARVSPCAALSGRRAGTSGRARHATAARLLATLVTQGRGQWGSHWRRQKAAAATVEAAPKHHQLLWDRPCCSCSAGHQHQPAAGQCHLLVSTGERPTQLSHQLLTRSSG